MPYFCTNCVLLSFVTFFPRCTKQKEKGTAVFQQYTFRMVGYVKCRLKKRIVKGAEAEVFWLVVFNIGHASKAQTSPNAT